MPFRRSLSLSGLSAWIFFAACGGGAGSEFGGEPQPGAANNGDLGTFSGLSPSTKDGGSSSPVCGNAAQETGETCDDGNTQPGDGCSATCTLETGWKCATLGAACQASGCGDGIVAGTEDCDDGNTQPGDGCDALCSLENKFKCETPGKPCTATLCGDGKKEGTEQCDDGNTRPYDGCSRTCTVEPKCAGGSCTAVCGDGVKFPGEACDDGNTRSGDGCSATCTLEPGFTCTVVTSGLPDSIDIPIVYRDFKKTHPDFEVYGGMGITTGLVKPLLSATGFPDFLSILGSDTYGRQITSDATFAQWWLEDPAIEKTIFDQSLTFNKTADNTYLYANTSFFPLDDIGWGNEGNTHNYHFTSELRYYFTYKGNENLDFAGDDDVWVFVNGHLAVDIGGVHPARSGSVTLTPAKATEFGLTAGGMYELDLFQAERMKDNSNYTLTLGGFEREKTACVAVCGDGVKTRNEACDDGTNAGGYGKCAPVCQLGPRCGDGVVQADQGEICDDGNLVDGDTCSSRCTLDGTGPK